MRKPIVMIVIAALVVMAVFAAVARPGGSPQVAGQAQIRPLGAEGAAPADTGDGGDGAAAPQFETGAAVQFDVSPALRDIAPIAPQPWDTVREMSEPFEAEEDQGQDVNPPTQVQDGALQAEFGFAGQPAPGMPAPIQNFDGVGNVNGVYPPDTNGDVGPNHYVEWVNLSFQIFNKSGASLYGPAAGNTIWTGFGGPCETRNDGDPVVLYDQMADRWLMSQFTAANPYGECVAISTTGDPTGSYYRYFFQFSTSVFYDYPKLGIWPDGYYLTANRFGGVFQTFQGASAIVLDRAKMLNGQAATFQAWNLSTTYGSLLPADLEGSTLPPGGTPNFFMERGSNVLRLWKLSVNWTTPANSTFTGPTSLTTAAFNVLCSGTRSCIPQPGTSVRLDGIGDRLMHRLVYRNLGTHQSLLVSHSVNAASSGTQAGVRWYEVRNPNGTPSIFQQGTYAPDATNRWMPSISMDRDGNIALVYSAASASVFPSIRYVGRLAGDPLGTLPQGETTLIAGTGSQTGTGSRWGDYAMISLDPVDDCTFWMTTEYIQTTGSAPWKTRIGSFKFPSCGGVVPTPTNTSVPPTATNTPTPTNTSVPPTATNTGLPPTATNTAIPPTATFTPTPGSCPNPSGGDCRTDNETRAWIAGTTNQNITADDTTKTVTLPFTFRFAGTNYTSVKISSNGNIHFGTASSAYNNVAIPNTGNPNALIAALWDDLNPASGGAIYTAVSGSAPNRVFVIEWRNVPRYNAGTNGATFQIQLVETTNHIWMLYQDTDFGNASYNSGASATSGVENSTGSAGNPYSFNQAVLTANKVLHFWPQ